MALPVQYHLGVLDPRHLSVVRIAFAANQYPSKQGPGGPTLFSAPSRLRHPIGQSARPSYGGCRFGLTGLHGIAPGITVRREGSAAWSRLYVSRKRRSATVKRANGQQRKPQSPAKAPWWKHPLVWLGGLATLLAGGAATAFGTGIGDSLFSAVHNPPGNAAAAVTAGPPVVIDAVTPDGEGDGFSYVLPQRLILAPQQLKSLNKLGPNDPQYDQWFTSRGGAVPSPALLKLVVEGNRSHPVLIIDMGIVDHCTNALAGTLFSNGSNGGSIADLAVQFDLDLPHPVPVNGNAGGNYFTAHSISLKKGEQAVFEIAASSARYCQYQIALTVVDGTKTLTETVSDHGQPFKVTGLLPKTRYSALYQGANEPGDSAPFRRENPATQKTNL